MKNRLLVRSYVMQGVFFILLPLFISFMMYGRMVVVLRNYMETQVAAQAADLGELFSQKLSAQFDELERVAGYYRDERVEEAVMIDSLERLLSNSGHISCGILKLGGKALYGEDLQAAEYPAIQRAFRGYSTVRYREGKGLLFTVPVYNGNNIKYVLYEFCDIKELFSAFKLCFYDGQAQFFLADGNQQKAIPVIDGWEWNNSFVTQETTQEALGRVKEKLDTSMSAAAYCNGSKGKEFLFVSEIENGNLYVLGRVPYKVVAGNISSLSYMTLLVFILLLVLLCIGTFNMFNANEKAKESDALREAKRNAEEANKSKSKFLANMSHELRTPINVILGTNEMILREEISEITRERAMDIKGAAQILLGLINDVLDFSTIEAGNLNIIPVEYDLVAMIRDLVLLSENRARQKSLNFEMKIQPDLPIGLYGDDIHIRQVMVNLLTNAVKYTEKGTITLEISGEKKGDNCMLLHYLVKDTGIGIREEDIKKMFLPFSRLDEQRNRNVEGNGLGLSIIINLLKLMGSHLEVKSVYGEGSSFYFDLEQKIVDAEPVGNIQKRLDNMAKDYKYQVSFIAPQAQILMVDDNSMNRKLFVSLLKKTQIKIATASSGKNALEMVQRRHFDLIFMDYLMPEMSGEETLRCLRTMENNLCKDTPVIALTANAFNGAKEHYMNMGFDDFLAKPIVAEKLEALLWELLPKEYITEAVDSIKEDGTNKAAEEIAASENREESLPEIEGVNWEYAQLFLKDKEILMASLHDFYQNIDMNYQKLSELSKNIDTEEGLAEYRICVHALKSNAALLGILSVSELAKLLEHAARDGERDKVYAANPILLEELLKIKERMQLSIDTKKAEDKPPADAAKLLSFLEMLRFSMEQMDINGADNCMKQIQSYSYGQELQELVERIGQKVAVLDYDGAGEEIEEIRRLKL